MELYAKKKPEFAHYYGDWIWAIDRIDWVKSLLLFFDGIALALPPHTAEAAINQDPVLAQPLAEAGLLRNFPPELWLPSLPEGEFDAPQEGPGEESFFAGNPMTLEALIADYDDSVRLTREAMDSLGRKISVYVGEHNFNSLMRALTVGMTTRFLVEKIEDVSIQPVIDDDRSATFVESVIGSPAETSLPNIVVSDMEQVGLDLGAIPLNDILDFRRENGQLYRAYARELRQFVLSLSLLSEHERELAVAERRAELDDRAQELQRLGRSALGRPAVGLLLGVTGAAWTLVHGGDPVGGVLGLGAALGTWTRPGPGPVGAAYTYVFKARDELHI